MGPIITLPIGKVERVVMSPCERYVLTYSPMGDDAYTLWDFQLVTLLRAFSLEEEDDENTWRWSSCGNYIAKQYRKEIERDDHTKRLKEGISIYELPSMDLLKTAEGVMKSLSIESLKEWSWVAGKQMIAYTSFLPELDEDEEEEPK